ncbi:hypothetical protein NOCA2310070 [metagenome]|uniref:Uncharacterized protein n=1 Tax=metagenome TaxID=256318 RepID=A0A2P2C1M8_9ZZZZ
MTRFPIRCDSGDSLPDNVPHPLHLRLCRASLA